MTTAPVRDDADRTAADVAWNIEDLVDGKGEAGVDALLDEARARADAIAGRYREQIAELDSARLADLMHAVAEVSDLLGRAGSYAGLKFSINTTDPAAGALMSRSEE